MFLLLEPVFMGFSFIDFLLLERKNLISIYKNAENHFITLYLHADSESSSKRENWHLEMVHTRLKLNYVCKAIWCSALSFQHFELVPIFQYPYILSPFLFCLYCLVCSISFDIRLSLELMSLSSSSTLSSLSWHERLWFIGLNSKTCRTQ